MKMARLFQMKQLQTNVFILSSFFSFSPFLPFPLSFTFKLFLLIVYDTIYQVFILYILHFVSFKNTLLAFFPLACIL